MSEGANVVSVVPTAGTVPLLLDIARPTAWLAAIFCVAVGSLLLRNNLTHNAADLRASSEIAALKAELKANPLDDALKQRLRDFDLQLRHEFFQRQAFAEHGAWLLIFGAALFLISAKYAATRQLKLVISQGGGSTFERPARVLPSDAKARAAVAGIGLCLAGGVVALLSAPQTEVTAALLVEKPAPEPVAAAPLPSAEEYRKQWPRFRGPAGSGISCYANVPADWDEASGRNVLWKAALPVGGESSPVVWDNRIFLTGVQDPTREVLCFDTSGKLLWHKPIPPHTGTAPTLMDNSGAASTCATDGLRVYALFATGDLVCFDFDGKPVWSKKLGLPDNRYGHASSLATWRHLLLVQYDQGAVEDNKSVLLAFDGATGKQAWKTLRPVAASWTTPIVVNVGEQEQIITAADPWVVAYEPAAGRELWRIGCFHGQELAPSPVVSGSLVYVVHSEADLFALRLDGKGDVTATHKLWTAKDGLPDITSPLCDGEHVYLLTGGRLTSYSADKGQKLGERDLEGTFLASPSLAGKRLFVANEEGVTYVVEAGREFKQLGRAELKDKLRASFAFADGRIYIRGEKNLYAIGEKK